MNEKFDYNFVFLFSIYDYYRAILGNEVINHPQVRYYKRAFNGNPFLQKIFRLHWSNKLNSIINLPFKRVWFRKMYEQNFDNDLPVCFVFFSFNYLKFDGGFTKYIKKRNPLNKIVSYHHDLISKKCDYDYNIIKNKVDLSVTYDKDESEKYNIHYFRNVVYSKIIPEPEKTNFEYDVYFLGNSKDRLEKIYEIFNYLSKNNVKCKFQLAGVPKEEQIDAVGLEYVDNIPYEENIKNVIKSKCILEIIQGGSSDVTLRTCEAIAYRRKLLTDCSLCDENFFNDNQLQKFNDALSIDIEFIKEDFSPEQFNPKINFSPLTRLFDIQSALEENNESTFNFSDNSRI